MLAEIANIVNLLRAGVDAFRKNAKTTHRDLTVERLLKIYFVLTDVVDEAEALFGEAGPDPFKVLNSLEPNDASALLAKWNESLDRQTGRLLFLQDKLVGQSQLEIIDPGLLRKIDEAIGDKMQRTFTLHGLGASLVFRPMFSDKSSKKDVASYVLALSGNDGESDVLNMAEIELEVKDLRNALERYRMAIQKLVTPEELAKLSKKARDETELP